MLLALLLALNLLDTPPVAKVKVVRFDGIESPVALRPQDLRGDAPFMSTMTIERKAHEIFKPLLSDLTAKEIAHPVDLRWGLLFFDAKAVQVHELYVDGFGRRGYLDGKYVEFNIDLGLRLRQQFDSLL